MENKIIALAQHLGLGIIEYMGNIYTGSTLKEFNEFSGANYEDVEDIDWDSKPFIEWLDNNCTVIENEIVASSYNENLFEYGDEEYLVVTDDEADELWEEDLDNYLEECVYPELQGNLKNYFDDEKWKNDARYDGRGHSLGRYDGKEHSQEVNEETYYIYRQN